jgi:predicted branched-subunit amino acid permease
MRGLGLAVCTIGIVIATLSTFAYLSDYKAGGIAGMVFGGGLFLIGAMMFIAEVALLLLGRRVINVDFRFHLLGLQIGLHAAIGKPDDDEERYEQIL